MTTATFGRANLGQGRDQTKAESQIAVVWRRFRRHKVALLGVAALLFIFLFSFLGPLFMKTSPTAQVAAPDQLPDATHIFGTDEIGRDVLVRLMWAGRISLLIAFSVTFLSQVFGVIFGAVAGYYVGWVDAILMRIVDFMLTLPLLPVLLIVSAFSLRGGLPISLPSFINNFFAKLWATDAASAEQILILVLILGAFSWMGAARLVRGVILSLRTQEFAEAARALGGSSWGIIFKHMIPNALAPILVSATLGIADIILTESALSFLGFGVQIPTPSWGNMLFNAQADMFTQPWRALVPGLAIFMTSLSANFVGDALRDALDPRLKL